MLFDNWPCVLRVRTTEQEEKTSGFIVQLTTKRFARQCIEIEDEDDGDEEKEEGERQTRKTGGRICFSRALSSQGQTDFYRLWCKPCHWQVQRQKRLDGKGEKSMRFDGENPQQAHLKAREIFFGSDCIIWCAAMKRPTSSLELHASTLCPWCRTTCITRDNSVWKETKNHITWPCGVNEKYPHERRQTGDGEPEDSSVEKEISSTRVIELPLMLSPSVITQHVFGNHVIQRSRLPYLCSTLVEVFSFSLSLLRIIYLLCA